MWHTPIGHLLQRKVINNLKQLQKLQILNEYNAF